MSRRLCSAIAIAIGLAALPASAQQPDPVLQTIVAIQNLLKQRPNDPTLYFYLASFQSQAGQHDAALASLDKTIELGDGFLPGSHFGFDKVLSDPGFIAARARFEAKLPKVADAPVAFTMPDLGSGPEGIAYDPVSKSFFVGSITRKSVVRITPAGKVVPFSRPEAGLHGVLGVAVDAKRRVVYAVSTNALVNGLPRRNAVVAFDLPSGRRIAEYSVNEAVQLNDVAVAPDGTLYATDSAAGGVWKLAVAREAVVKPTALLKAGTVRGSNGVAVSGDGKLLYVAHSTGIVRVELASGAMEKVVIPARDTVAAIDGLYVVNGDLVGIQNITNPGRVIRMRLDPTGKEVTRVDTLQSHHNPAFHEPTTGAVAGDAIYVLGTTQLPRYNQKGELEDMGVLKAPKIVKVPLKRS